jgi:hypothetical protein
MVNSLIKYLFAPVKKYPLSYFFHTLMNLLLLLKSLKNILLKMAKKQAFPSLKDASSRMQIFSKSVKISFFLIKKTHQIFC